ncbi:hypothetical protein ACQ4M4_18055 [Leptolyngbya sp. AN02str]|uniref:hypothetical protein n=1 Tax=Leptolyngbya sp. AN02str TaxID=3423363 RepID=UPI003D314C75
MTHSIKMPSIPPQKGEVWLAVNLSKFDSPGDFLAAVEMAEKLGLDRKLCYRDTNFNVEIFLLCHYAQHNYESYQLPEDFLVDEHMELSHHFGDAVEFVYALKKGRELVAA